MRDSALREETAVSADTDADPDDDAAAAFANRARADHGDAIDRLVAFGDAVRGDDRGVHAAVEFLVVLEDEADGDTDAETETGLDERERRLERLAETVGVEHGVVVEVYVLPADRFEARRDHPLVRQALEGGRSYV